MPHRTSSLEYSARTEAIGVARTTGDGNWSDERSVASQESSADGGGEARGRGLSRDWYMPTQRQSKSVSTRSQSHMSPPLTPRASKEALPAQPTQQVPVEPEPTFHNYLRAFYHFHPTSTVSSSGDESSITVPINQGDVILVHSVHPNGWADGTLLVSGARGWLPTNYCEPYDHPAIRNLLNALTHLWDLVRSNEHETLLVFSRQDYVRGMIAGVRFFLEQTSCLSRDSPLIVSHVGLRRLRKGLLGDLSTLVRIAKQLQDTLHGQQPQTAVYELLDELVLKAFKVVTRAVRFLDIWSQDVDDENNALDFQPTTANTRPPTPPGDTASEVQSSVGADRENCNEFGAALSEEVVQPNDQHSQPPSADTNTNVESEVSPTITGTRSSSILAQTQQVQTQQLQQHPPQAPQAQQASPAQSPNPNLTSTLSSQGSAQTAQFASRPLSFSANRLSVSHRLSYISKGGGVQRQNLASERLSAAHDSFLGLLGTFIGLHLTSRSSEELAATTQQSVVACRNLLAVVEEVWARDGRRSDSLQAARDVMYQRLAELVQATRDMFISTQSGEELLNPDQGRQLVMTTTNCIRAAGDCVSKARITIERIGDFEFEINTVGLAEQVFEALSQNSSKAPSTIAATAVADDPITRSSSSLDKPLPVVPGPPEQPNHRPPPPPLTLAPDSKPLPEPPKQDPMASPDPPGLRTMMVDSPEVLSARSSKSSFTGPQPLAVPLSLPSEVSPTSSTQSPAVVQNEFTRTLRTDSVNTSAADTTSTWRNSMPDGASTVSLTSTRATTPDRSPVQQQEEGVMMNSIGSVSELQSVISEETNVEEQVLEKTFAHELIYNKEGQVVGGSLPALIECLTTHDATPDAMFVTTFYLTFRLFTTPVDFAQGLVDRFDYIGDSPNVGVPVRLRIYNVFKGWLETHWQPEADSDVLSIIQEFATAKLNHALPTAGKRILELAAKVSDLRDGALVPRLVSSLGKTSTSVTLFSAADSHIPNPNVTKSQLNALRQARVGGPPCSILDFDPMELARQFTIIESRIFCSIGPEELLALEWSKKTDSRAVNVKAMSTLSTDLAHLVVDTILQFEEPKKRAAIIKQWVKISTRCLELNNYDSLMAIVCSLDSITVTRLKKTWEVVSQKTKNRFDELRAITDISKNYNVLRERLKNHVAPCIPFVGVYLTDLTFVHDGNPPTRELAGSEPKRSVINFDRYMKTARVIGQLQRFQVPYRLAAVPEMQEWMEAQIARVRNAEGANVQSYYRRSLLLEPREAQQGPSKAHWFSQQLGGQAIQTPQPQQQQVVQQVQQVQVQQQQVDLGRREGHSSKESVGGISTKEKFDLLGTLHIRERERVGSQ